MSQKIYIDTEFTGFSDPKLISIGLVAETGQEFYAEVKFDFDECSEFVRETVIPLLGQNEKFSLEELQPRLAAWIEKVRVPGPMMLCFDSDYDRKMLECVFKNDFPNGVVLQRIPVSFINQLRQYEFHILNKQPEHHALCDARALKYAIRK
ncbi:3'-5' exoribonuclease domain-containing protein [Massilia phyllosphaerae]|uniref:3'-5' exoribonuclease domain-containing protein n=1 Tax=Massilia phyllosphaerae TaxID=3106034 RepID=UPI002B1CBEDA|nr:3'-5' exoribonuclease [Massilia sp. SGZ-792]